jgi:hypothetical protein
MIGIKNLRIVRRNVANKSRNEVLWLSVKLKLCFQCSSLCWHSYIPSDVMPFRLLISRGNIAILCFKLHDCLLWKPETFVIIIWNQYSYQSTNNALNNIQLMISVKSLHVSAAGCRPQSLILVMNCIPLSEFVRWYIDCEDTQCVNNVKYL